MKLFISTIILSFSFLGYSQNTDSYNFFAQGMFDVEASEMEALQEELRLHPDLQVVRLDKNSNKFFILTYQRTELTELELLSWFDDAAEFVRCIQIGRQGIDIPNRYPYPNCEQ